MNDVSWRRILEQVDNGQQLAHDLDTSHATERAHVSKRPPQRNVDLSNLENELVRATRGDKPLEAKSKARPVRQRPPSPGQHATQLKMRMERGAVIPYTSPPLPEQAKSSVARNVIAIILSFAVFGLVAYQLRGTMQQNDAGSGISTARNASKTENAQPRIRVSGNRLDLRPSLATRSDWASKKLAAGKASDTTPPVNMAGISAILPSTGSSKPDNAVNESLILDRGHKILESGYVSGARLIFEYLADRGSALGAFALAQTYDPKFISTHNAPAYLADNERARIWYQRAADLTEEARSEAK